MKRFFPLLGIALLLSAALFTLALTGEAVKDPVCGMEVNPATATNKLDAADGTVYFCSPQCLEAYKANPAAYVQKPKVEEKKEPAATGGCADCPAHKKAAAAAATKEAQVKGCDGNCGHTKISAINEFHTLMTPLEGAVERGNYDLVKAAMPDLVAKKTLIMKAADPEGNCPESFSAKRDEFGAKVDALAAAAQGGDQTAIASAFKEMHRVYGELDQLAR